MLSEIHSFNVDIAQEYGIEEAILIQHFHHWISHNRRLNRNFHENRTWTYLTHAEIAANFPYLNPRKVKYIIESLVRKGVLIKGNFNKNSFDQTTWYAFKNEEMFTKDKIVSSVDKFVPSDETKLSHVYTNTDTNTNIDVFGDVESDGLGAASSSVSLEKNEIKIRGPRNTSTLLTKEGVKNTIALKQHKWTDDEIEYAWEALANHKKPITNWLSFIKAVIKNRRSELRKQNNSGGYKCNTRTITLPPTELGIRIQSGQSIDNGTLSSMIASRPNVFQEYCYPKKPNEN